jgi:uncharacterized protein
VAEDLFDYDAILETALRGAVREALSRAAAHGLRGDHHFYLSFRTRMPGVVVPDYLAAKFPDEMTIVLQHQFWDLEIGAESFSVTLSFQNRLEQLTVPFAAVTAFADPSVKFGLQFGAPVGAGLPAVPAAEESGDGPAPAEEKPEAEIVALDKFRKR